jgi:hypothetical protein
VADSSWLYGQQAVAEVYWPPALAMGFRVGAPSVAVVYGAPSVALSQRSSGRRGVRAAVSGRGVLAAVSHSTARDQWLIQVGGTGHRQWPIQVGCTGRRQSRAAVSPVLLPIQVGCTGHRQSRAAVSHSTGCRQWPIKVGGTGQLALSSSEAAARVRRRVLRSVCLWCSQRHCNSPHERFEEVGAAETIPVAEEATVVPLSIP